MRTSWRSRRVSIHSTTLIAEPGRRRLHQNRIIGVSLDMFFEILRPLEGLAAEITFVRLQGNMDSDVGGDVIALDSVCAATAPCALEIEVVGALATDMAFTDMFLRARN